MSRELCEIFETYKIIIALMNGGGQTTRKVDYLVENPFLILPDIHL